MSYADFPQIILPPTRFTEIERANVVRSRFAGGYVQTRPRYTRMPKVFRCEWINLTPDEKIELQDFFRTCKGGADAFYWTYPVGIYGAPGYGGLEELFAGYDDAKGEGVGYGEGPRFLVRYVADSLEYYIVSLNYWNVACELEEV